MMNDKEAINVLKTMPYLEDATSEDLASLDKAVEALTALAFKGKPAFKIKSTETNE